MSVEQIDIAHPFLDQSPGTSGLRRPTAVFQQRHYLECFLQAVFDADPPPPGAALVVGGDGRFFSKEAAGVTALMAVANGFETVIVGCEGLLSTPAASALVRSRRAHGAIILSASHNPGGKDGDFGVKYNVANGGPAGLTLTDDIHRRTMALRHYRTLNAETTVDIETIGIFPLQNGWIEVIDPVAHYIDLMAEIFDFPAIKRLISDPAFRMRFDAMNAVTGPYARALFEDRLGAPPGTVIRAIALPDFGGIHPDPHLDHLETLQREMFGDAPPDFAAASDGDGDRNLVLGPALGVSPGDSLAILAANAALIPYYRHHGLIGTARSLPTSRAVDRVSSRLGIPCYETPTGWKYFSSLLDAGKINLCGEESFGTGSDHIREKDGLWAILFWLSIIATRSQSVTDIVADHWREYGRDYYARHDYDGLDKATADSFMANLRLGLATVPGTTIGDFRVVSATDVAYVDPIDQTVTKGQGVQFILEPDARITFRLSGTGSSCAALRVYLEQYESPTGSLFEAPSDFLADLAATSVTISDIGSRLGSAQPHVTS